MRTATFPAVRTTPENRALVESVLRPGETLSTFIEETLYLKAQRRKEDEAFYARALASSELVKTGKMRTYSLDEVMKGLNDITTKKKHAKAATKQTASACKRPRPPPAPVTIATRPVKSRELVCDMKVLSEKVGWNQRY